MPGRFIGARCRICSTSRALTPRGFGHLKDGLGACFVVRVGVLLFRLDGPVCWLSCRFSCLQVFDYDLNLISVTIQFSGLEHEFI